MKIALIGATGFIGSALLAEALSRKHDVMALVAHPEKLAGQDGVRVQAADVMDAARLAAQLEGFDAVISAFSGHAQVNTLDYYVQGIKNVIAASKAARVPRLLVVGGAGSLFVAPGVQAIDTPEFPAMYKPTAEGARQALLLLRQESKLDWCMLSPAAVIAPGARTGVFRLGGDDMLFDASGKSAISVDDYAMAMIDELERPAHSRKRFTVAY